MKIKMMIMAVLSFHLLWMGGGAAVANPNNDIQTATVGGGCFWCLEPIFAMMDGVESVESGYAGGHFENPTYDDVVGGYTGHAEVVQIRYKPDIVSYDELLKVFFEIHDPTTLNRQGYDMGTQYRSIILYENDGQKESAEIMIRTLTDEKVWHKPIVTEVKPLKQFYKAEAHHQDYYQRNSDQPYCRLVIAPKIRKYQKNNK